MERFETKLKTTFFLCAIESLLSAIYLITVPVSSANETSGILGFSGIRFVILLVMLALFGLFFVAWVFVKRNTSSGKWIVDGLKRFSKRNSLLNLQSVLLLGTGISVYLLWKWLALPSTYEYDITLPRLLPIGFLLFVCSLQSYLILFFSKPSPKQIKFDGFANWVRNGQVPSKRIALDLGIIAVILVVASIVGQAIKYFTPYYSYLDFLIVEFFLDSEENLPTYFSSFILLFSAVLLAIKAQHVKKLGEKFVFHWGLLSVVFVYLAADEVLQIHEMLTEPVREMFNTSGAFFFAWYIPVIPLLILLGLYYLKFILALPNRYKIGYIVSAFAYLMGVIGIEIVGSTFGHQYGLGNFPYTMIATLEEVIEMGGIISFIYFNWELNQITDNSPGQEN
jgi:hypothetical protein